jgi:hypothetical protein
MRILSALALLVLATGCGGDSGGETTAAGTEQIEYPEGPTREFFIPGGDNVVQLFGREASEAEREQASRVIQAWMRARAAGAWGEVCRHFDRETASYAIRSAASIMQRQVPGCARSIEVVFAKTDRSRANTMTGPIDSLRISQGHGYAQYHGRDGADWIVPVAREDGEWRVAIFDPVDRLK